MRTILVTGATGAIGSVLCRVLLEEEGTQLRLLLRAQSAEHLQQRMRELCAFWEIDPDSPRVADRVRAIAGDVTCPQLGLDDTTYQMLSREVTHVIHAAGNVNLSRPLDEARHSAVGAARQIVLFATACRANGRLAKLEYVSTVGVAGKRAGTLPERPVCESRSFHNTYEEAKADAETFVLDAIANGVPATIHRPSMVVGESTTGRIIRFQVFYYLCEFLSGRRTAGVIPAVGDTRLDIVPVDYVARAIRASSLDAVAVGRVFHLCSGPEGSPKLVDLARDVRAVFVAHGVQLPPLRVVPQSVMRALVPVVSRLAPTRARRSLQSLPYFLSYLEESQAFGNVQSGAYFAAQNVSLPRVESYLGAVLSYYMSRGAGLPGQPSVRARVA